MALDAFERLKVKFHETKGDISNDDPDKTICKSDTVVWGQWCIYVIDNAHVYRQRISDAKDQSLQETTRIPSLKPPQGIRDYSELTAKADRTTSHRSDEKNNQGNGSSALGGLTSAQCAAAENQQFIHPGASNAIHKSVGQDFVDAINKFWKQNVYVAIIFLLYPFQWIAEVVMDIGPEVVDYCVLSAGMFTVPIFFPFVTFPTMIGMQAAYWLMLVYNKCNVRKAAKRYVNIAILGATMIICYIVYWLVSNMWKKRKETPQPSKERPMWVTVLGYIASIIGAIALLIPLIVQIPGLDWILKLSRDSISDLNRSAPYFANLSEKAEKHSYDELRKDMAHFKVIYIAQKPWTVHKDRTDAFNLMILPSVSKGEDAISYDQACQKDMRPRNFERDVSTIGDIVLDSEAHTYMWIIGPNSKRIYIRSIHEHHLSQLHEYGVYRNGVLDFDPYKLTDKDVYARMDMKNLKDESFTTLRTEFRKVDNVLSSVENGTPQAWFKLATGTFLDKYVSWDGVLLSTVVLIVFFTIAMAYREEKGEKEARAFFRQIPATDVSKRCVPVFGRKDAQLETNLCDVMTKVKFKHRDGTSGTYWVLTQHVFDFGFDPYVKDEKGKEIDLKPLVKFIGGDIALIPAGCINLKGIEAFTQYDMNKTQPIVFMSYAPSTLKPVLSWSLATRDDKQNRVTYDCDTINFQCGSPVVDAQECSHIFAIHDGTYGNGSNYGALLPSTIDQDLFKKKEKEVVVPPVEKKTIPEPQKPQVNSNLPMKSGNKGKTSGQNRARKDQDTIKRQRHDALERVNELTQRRENIQKLISDYSRAYEDFVPQYDNNFQNRERAGEDWDAWKQSEDDLRKELGDEMYYNEELDREDLGWDSTQRSDVDPLLNFDKNIDALELLDEKMAYQEEIMAQIVTIRDWQRDNAQYRGSGDRQFDTDWDGITHDLQELWADYYDVFVKMEAFDERRHHRRLRSKLAKPRKFPKYQKPEADGVSIAKIQKQIKNGPGDSGSPTPRVNAGLKVVVASSPTDSSVSSETSPKISLNPVEPPSTQNSQTSVPKEVSKSPTSKLSKRKRRALRLAQQSKLSDTQSTSLSKEAKIGSGQKP